MNFVLGALPRHLARAATVAAIALSAGACSSIPDWANPFSDDDTVQTSDTTPPGDDQTQTAQTSTNAVQPAANSQFPDLADNPARPTAPSTSDEQKQTAASLAADRARQNYSADALRAGTEAAAAPPSDAPPPSEVAEVAPSARASAQPDASSGADNTPAPSSSSSSDSSAAPTAAPTQSVAATPAPDAQVPASSGGPPAVPAVPPGSIGSNGIPGSQSVAMTDSALGFQPSRAPALDPSVAQFVPAPIIARYQQTASLSGTSGLGNSSYAAATGPAVPFEAPMRGRAMGGPEAMSGAVVANFDALQGVSVATPGVYANAQGLPAAASVYFAQDRTILSADAKAQVRAAAQAYIARGSAGYIRVVGYASSNSTKLSAARRLEWNFEHSQARANAVARELIGDGVPATKVLVEARGDAQADSYGAAPAGADGNRRADIFIQG